MKAFFGELQREAYAFFQQYRSPLTGLTADSSAPDAPASMTAIGMGMSADLVAVELGLLSREAAVERAHQVLRFFIGSEQSRDERATGYRGFYYHFLDRETGKRAWKSELSTIDTAFFIAGALSAAEYFSAETGPESEIRRWAFELYRRVDWRWAMNRGTTLTHGWKPGRGFLRHRWSEGYSEALLLYVLALGAPEFPIPGDAYREWTKTFRLTEVFGTSYLYAGPLFVHQYSHLWLDFRELSDDFNRRSGLTYFENSRRAVQVHHAYGAAKSRRGELHWGLTAGDRPGNRGKNYLARGAPFGPDDGTFSPAAVAACLPFDPERVTEYFSARHDRGTDRFLRDENPRKKWISPQTYALHAGPVVLMIENHRREFLWRLLRNCRSIQNGLNHAGFRPDFGTYVSPPASRA